MKIMNLKSKKSLMKVLLAPFLVCLTMFASGIYDNGNTALATDLETTKDYFDVCAKCEELKNKAKRFAKRHNLPKQFYDFIAKECDNISTEGEYDLLLKDYNNAVAVKVGYIYEERVNNLPDAVDALRKGMESKKRFVELIVDKDPDNPVCKDFSELNDDEIAALIFSKYIDANFKLDCVMAGAYNWQYEDNNVIIRFEIDHCYYHYVYKERVNNLPDAVDALRKGMESKKAFVDLIVDKDPDNSVCKDFSGLNDDEIAALIFSKYIDANFKLDCHIVRASSEQYGNNNVRIRFGTDHYGYKNQEEQIQINNRTLEVRKELKLDGKSDFEKVELICNYIVKNVEYDEDKRTLYDASVSGKGNCVARSAWFCKLCREENIRSELISASGKDGGEGHVWNIVKIGDLFYYIDVTAVTNGEINEKYFLKGENDFPNLNSFDMYLGQIFASKFFQEVCPISKLDYFDMESFEHQLENRMTKYFLNDIKLQFLENFLKGKENMGKIEKQKALEKYKLNMKDMVKIENSLESDYQIVSQISSKKAEETRSLLKTYIERINRVWSLLSKI